MHDDWQLNKRSLVKKWLIVSVLVVIKLIVPVLVVGRLRLIVPALLVVGRLIVQTLRFVEDHSSGRSHFRM